MKRADLSPAARTLRTAKRARPATAFSTPVPGFPSPSAAPAPVSATGSTLPAAPTSAPSSAAGTSSLSPTRSTCSTRSVRAARSAYLNAFCAFLHSPAQ